jgi:hypothetical protein
MDLLPLTDLLALWDSIDSNGTDKAAMRALCLEDRYYLLVKVFKRTDLLHQWIYERCREVEANPDGYLDLWAREHYKSTIITYAGAIQELLRNPNITIGIFSHTQSIAKDFLGQIKRELDNNELLHELFPDILWGTKSPPSGAWNLEQLTVKRNTNPKESTIEAHGLVEGMPTGKHFELMIYDDVVVPASVTTPEQIQKTTTAWELSDNLGARGVTGLTRKWHIGTRYSYADTYDVMIKRGVVKTRIYPATKDGTINGEPVLLTQEQWEEKKKTQGSSTLACQMLQDPLSGTDRMFDVKDIGEYDIRPHTLNVYIMVDPARSMKKDSDNTAIAVIGVDVNLNKFLLDGINHRCDLSKRWEWTYHLYKKWKNTAGVQQVFVGYEKYGAIADLDYFAQQMKLHGKFEITELTGPKGGGLSGNASKKDRVQRLEPDFKQHRFFTPYVAPVGKLTKRQAQMKTDGQEHRISAAIKRKDSDNIVYNLVDQFLAQVHYFPHGGKVDLIDAVSRIYDMDVQPPFVQRYTQEDLEPLYI